MIQSIIVLSRYISLFFRIFLFQNIFYYLNVLFYGDARPALKVLGPSSEELKQGEATVMCLANKGFPSDWSLSWKESRSPVVQENDGLYSWSSTLRLPADHWMKVGSVTCEATQGSHTLVSEPLMRDQCPQS
uniref:Ig-like domain-containing protein n=1 Tax=Maylandia zebra TaxID=106582 RepID=A0A3P9DPF5_9CICH